MKSIISLRLFSILSFLILTCPFYDSCNGHGISKSSNSVPVEVPVEEVSLEQDTIVNDSIAKSKIEIQEPIIEEKTSKIQEFYESIDDENSQSAFEFANMTFSLFAENSYQELKASCIKGIRENDYSGFFFSLKNFSFLIIIILTFWNIFNSFKNNFLSVNKFSKWILISLITALICVFYEGLFEEISQIKWGYYGFALLTILVFYVSKILIKRQQP